MERHVVTVAQPLNLVTHVLEEKSVSVQVDLQTTFEEAQNELDAPHRNDTLQIEVKEMQ